MKYSRALSFAALLALPAFLAPSPAGAQGPMTQPDDTWISLTGTVESVAPDQFVLDYAGTEHYGEGWITVEMDDGDRDADAYKLMEGDTVTVDGWIDDDFFEARTIEASSVLVHNLDTRFYASGVDEEDVVVTTTVVDPVVSQVFLEGTVTSVSDEEFVLDTGLQELRVEVEEMGYNPLDDVGYQQVDLGDRVSVTGYVDYDFLEGSEVVATSVTTLER